MHVRPTHIAPCVLRVYSHHISCPSQPLVAVIPHPRPSADLHGETLKDLQWRARSKHAFMHRHQWGPVRCH